MDCFDAVTIGTNEGRREYEHLAVAILGDTGRDCLDSAGMLCIGADIPGLLD